MTEEGYFRDDRVEGLATQTLTNGERYAAEYTGGAICGSITGYAGDGSIWNAIVQANNTWSFRQVVTNNPEAAWFRYAKPKTTLN